MSHLTPEEIEALAANKQPSSEHLTSCEKCTKSVRVARGRQQLLKGMTPYTLSDMAFSRVDAKLTEQMRQPVRSFAWLWATGSVAAALIIGAYVYMSSMTGEPHQLGPASFEPMTVVAARGDTTLKAGDVLGRGSKVSANNAEVTLATADGDMLRLSGGASFTLDAHRATVALESGSLWFEALRGGPWSVRVGEHRLETSDALINVSPNAFDVFRGSVRLDDSRVVNAPAHLDFATGALSPLQGDAKMPAAVKPPWALLQLDLSADDVDLDGQRVGPAPFSMMTSPGRHHLRAGDREGDFDLTTSGSGTVDFPAKAPIVAAPTLPAGPHIDADPEAIAKAIRAQLPKLRVCHEKWLKVDSSARGKVEMALTVSPKGKVTKATFTAAEDVPASIDDCLARAARTLVLPQSSEEVELQMPVMLGAQ